VPEDVSLVGFDDDYIGAHAVPPLTTMRVEKSEMGRRALAMLKDIIDDQTVASVRLPATLIPRASVSGAPSAVKVAVASLDIIAPPAWFPGSAGVSPASSL
jgi:hypothetical protein